MICTMDFGMFFGILIFEPIFIFEPKEDFAWAFA